MSKHTRQDERGAVWVSVPVGWLVSTFQLSGAPDVYPEQPNYIITSILPRQEERSERSRGTRESVSAWTEDREEVSDEEVRDASREPGEHKRERVRGGCLGAEGRRRTRRPAKRSGGAACERRALRIRMGQPVQSDVWTPPAECNRQAGGQWAN